MCADTCCGLLPPLLLCFDTSPLTGHVSGLPRDLLAKGDEPSPKDKQQSTGEGLHGCLKGLKPLIELFWVCQAKTKNHLCGRGVHSCQPFRSSTVQQWMWHMLLHLMHALTACQVCTQSLIGSSSSNVEQVRAAQSLRRSDSKKSLA